MKNTLTILLLLINSFAFFFFIISELPRFNGNAENGLVPVTIGGITYRTTAKNFVNGKIDSVVIRQAIGDAPDTIYSYKEGIKTIVGLIPKGGDSGTRDTTINVGYYSRAGLRALNDTTIKVAFMSDYGYGTFARKHGDNTSADDNHLILVSADGGRWIRQNYDGLNIYADWFIPPGADADTADKTTYIQEAVNKSVYKNLNYTINREYCSRQIFVGFVNAMKFNYAILTPHWTFRMDETTLYNYMGGRINYNGTVTTGAGVHGSKQNIKKLPKILFENGIFRMKNYTIGCIRGSFESTKWTIVEGVEIKNCESYNCSSRSFEVAGSGYKNDSTPQIRDVLMNGVRTYYNGQNVGLYVNIEANIGDTSVYIKTVDGTNITGKPGVGQYIKFGSPNMNLQLPLLDTYAGSDKIYRIKRFVINGADSTAGRIDITGGRYSGTDGFIDSVMGLTSKVVANTIYLAVDNYIYPLLVNAANVDGTIGANTISQNAINTTQNARWKNIYPGMEISITNEPGQYKIVSISGTTATLDKPLLSTFANRQIRISGKQSDGVGLLSYIQKGTIKDSYFYANLHGIQLQHSGGKGIYGEGYDNNIVIDNNKFYYSWMHVESTVGNQVNHQVSQSGFNNKWVNKGDTSFRVAKSVYRMDTLDINNDLITEVVLTNLGTTKANINFQNCIAVGDIMASQRQKYRYRITSFTNGVDSITIGLQRWDNNLKKTVVGGFDVSAPLTLTYWTFNRVYSIYSGEDIGISNLTATRNEFYYTWRELGGGYNISVTAYNANVYNNKFFQSGSSSLEISGYSQKVYDNEFTFKFFDGSEILPASWTSRGSGGGASPGGIGTIGSQRADFYSNRIKFQAPLAPTENDYSANIGNVNIQADFHCLYPAERFNYSKNIVDGIRRSPFTTVLVESITGSKGSYSTPTYYYNEVLVENNSFILSGDYIGAGLFYPAFSLNSSINNNTITSRKPLTGDFHVLAAYEYTGFNPRLTDTSSSALYRNYKITENTYPVGTTPLFRGQFNRGQIIFNDDKKYSPLANGKVIVIDNVQTTVPDVSGGGGSGNNVQGNID